MNDNGHALRILIRPDAGVLKRSALAALALRVVTFRVVAFLVVALLVPVSASLLAASPLAAKEKPPAARQAEKPPQTPPDKIRLLLARPVDATTLPLLDAQAQGTFRAGNLDVAITPGTSDEETLLQIGRGLFDVGIVDFAALISYRAQVDGKTDKGNKSEPSPIKAIAVIFNRSAHAIVARKSRGIASFKDLAGKKLGLTGDDSLNLQWPALARLSELNPSSVTIERISPAVREPLLSAGQIDAVTALTYRTPIDIKEPWKNTFDHLLPKDLQALPTVNLMADKAPGATLIAALTPTYKGKGIYELKHKFGAASFGGQPERTFWLDVSFTDTAGCGRSAGMTAPPSRPVRVLYTCSIRPLISP